MSLYFNIIVITGHEKLYFCVWIIKLKKYMFKNIFYKLIVVK